jgi:uncharacterized protein
MAEISDKIRDKIKRLINELENDSIHIQRAVLFGSYANGNNNEWSDIDLALVSDNFCGNRWDDKALLRDYRAKIGWDIQVLPYRPEDLYSSWFVRDEILNKGIDIL